MMEYTGRKNSKSRGGICMGCVRVACVQGNPYHFFGYVAGGE